jgi:hypothetical protein
MQDSADNDPDLQRAILSSMSPDPGSSPGAAAASPLLDGGNLWEERRRPPPLPPLDPLPAPPPAPSSAPSAAPSAAAARPLPPSVRTQLMAEQDQAFQVCCDADRQRLPPTLPPAEPTEDGMPVRLKLRTGEVAQRQFSLEEPLRRSLVEFVHYRHQDRRPLRLGVRDGTHIRWLQLDESLQQQGILPMDLLLCMDER